MLAASDLTGRAMWVSPISMARRLRRLRVRIAIEPQKRHGPASRAPCTGAPADRVPVADNHVMTLAAPQLKFFADLSVRVDKPQEVGRTARGLRRLIPIVGG